MINKQASKQLNKWVFIDLLKTTSELEWQMLYGKQFQSLGAADSREYSIWLELLLMVFEIMFC